MRYNSFDACIIHVCCRIGVSEHILIVKDVEALVFHCSHVEVGYGNDIEDIKIIFAPEFLLVPTHGTFECIHGVKRAILFAMLDINSEIDWAS